MVQWLRNPPSNAGDSGSIPVQGTKIPHAHMPTCICEVSFISKGLGFYVQMHVHDYAFSRKGELGTCAVISLTLCDPMDCSPPGSSVRGDSPGQNTRVSCHALFHGIFDSFQFQVTKLY